MRHQVIYVRQTITLIFPDRIMALENQVSQGGRGFYLMSVRKDIPAI